MQRSSTRVLFVSPRFNDKSFWRMKGTVDLLGARCLAPPLGLITIAAMLPKHWDVRLIDRNADEALTDADILAVDLVMTGGMLPQEPDTLAIIAMSQRLGVPVCVGGPAPTSTPDIYAGADFLVVGEAEGVLGQFIADWEAGETKGRYDAPKFKADVTTTPIPRFDLIKFHHYAWINVQFSRGCPFTCEFCDIIELYGRAPRTKTTPQLLAELDRLYALGYRGHVDFVDDNLIGNKKQIKKFLPELKDWQEAARLSVQAVDRSVDEPRRRSRAARHDARRELLRPVHRDRDARRGDLRADAEEAEHPPLDRRQRAPHLRGGHVRGRRLRRRLRCRGQERVRHDDGLHPRHRDPDDDGEPADGAAEHAAVAPARQGGPRVRRLPRHDDRVGRHVHGGPQLRHRPPAPRDPLRLSRRRRHGLQPDRVLLPRAHHGREASAGQDRGTQAVPARKNPRTRRVRPARLDHVGHASRAALAFLVHAALHPAQEPRGTRAVVRNISHYVYLYTFAKYLVRTVDARIDEIDAGKWDALEAPTRGPAPARVLEPIAAVA